MTKTHSTKAKDIKRDWHLIDVSGKVLGREATRIARLLMGKDKPDRAPYLDCGDYVVVVNASRVAVTGKKESDKIYYRHSGYTGNLKQETLGKLRQRRPQEIIKRAVWGMLPKNKLRPSQMARLKIYAGGEHPHQAQLNDQVRPEFRSDLAR